MTTTINADNVTGGAVVTGDSSGELGLQTAGTTRMTITSAGNVGIGTTTPGNKLEVSGTFSASGVATFSAGTVTAPAITTSGDTNNGIYFPAADNVAITTGGTQRVLVDSSGNVGIGGTANAQTKVNALGTYPTSGTVTRVFLADGTIPSGTTAEANGFQTILNTQAASFTLGSLYHFQANGGTIGSGSTVTNQFGFAVASTLTGGTNNYGFYSNIASGSNRWNFYANGTADNYFAGNVGIGTSSPGAKLSVSGTSTWAHINGGNSNTAPIFASLNNETVSSATYGWLWYNNSTNGNLDLYRRNGSTTDTQVLSFDRSNGNVGIGSSSPGQALVIGRTGNAQILVTTVTSGNPSIYLDASGVNNGQLFVDRSDAGITKLQAGGNLVFQTNGATERMRIDTSGNLTCAGVYSATVGATNRDVYVDSGGLIGYVSSIRASKTNIADIANVSWLYQLNPVSYQYRKKDEAGNYTDEADGPIDFGLIAEDTELIKPELCFYDEVDGEQELRGISYSKLIVPMLKAIQEQQQQIDALKAEVAALKGE